MKTLINKLIEHKFKPSTIIKVYRVYNKIKAIIENILEWIGFNYVGYKVDIEINAKEIKVLNKNMLLWFNELKQVHKDIIRNQEHMQDRIKMLRGDINLNKSSINQLTHEAKSYVNDDDLQDKLYDFKHQHITPIEDVISNNDKTLFNEVATLKEHIKSVEKLANELCELNQIKERE